VPDVGAKIGEADPLEGVAVPWAAGSFNACFERLLCLWIPKGICLKRNSWPELTMDSRGIWKDGKMHSQEAVGGAGFPAQLCYDGLIHPKDHWASA
jgi:hypothetical protein